MTGATIPPKLPASSLTLKLPAFLALGCALVLASSAHAQTNFVEATAKPGHPWHRFPTRTLSDLPAAISQTTDGPLTAYGGLAAHQVTATGFFHPAKLNGRWWLVDPAGGLFVNKAVVSVFAEHSPAFQLKFGTATNWAVQTTEQLRQLGFNSLGAWSATDLLKAAPQPLSYTRIWNFMSTYGRHRGGTYRQPGHTGYPNDCIFVFDPGFVTFCDEYARQLAAEKDDPHLLGHFSDNELPFHRGLLQGYLSLPKEDPGQQAAMTWLRSRHGPIVTKDSVSPADDEEFLGYVVAQYFRIVSGAIKKYDPNHLFLGSRFHGRALAEPVIFRAAGPFLDVVSVNYYNAWTPDATRLAMWERESHKPVLITEWYAKGEDSGMPNTGGAGWLVKTQRERGEFYENFTLALLQSRVCVGWQWFRYMDNDLKDTTTDPASRDSNKGLLNVRYDPYAPLTDSMQRINSRAYTLVDYFDGQSSEPPTNGPPGQKGN